MAPLLSILTRVSTSAATVAGFFLVAIISSLAIMHYNSQVALQGLAMKESVGEAEKRASIIGYFYAERIDDLGHLTESRELSAYFENRALGMSMQYGLRASLHMAQAHFDRLRRTKKMGDKPIFKRILFANPNGVILLDSNSGEVSLCEGRWQQLLKESKKVGSLLCDTSGTDPYLVVSIPYYFKGKYEGVVMGWVSSSFVYDQFVSGREERSLHPIGLFYDGKVLHAPANSSERMPNEFPSDESRSRVSTRSITLSPGEKVTAIIARVEKTPLSLVMLVPDPEQMLRSPRYLLYATGGVALFIVVSLFFLLRLTVRNAVLKARLEETSVRERAVGEKNQQLQMESIERKKVEEEVRSLNAELEERVNQRTAELEVANRELEAFCYCVSHDLRAPLTRLEGFVQALVEDYSDRLEAEGALYAQRIKQMSLTLKQMIDGLLDLARLTRDEINWGRTNLSNIAERVAAELSEAEPERRVEFQIAPDLFSNGDQRLLRVVFENLLGNAWKFTSKNRSALIQFGAMDVHGVAVYFVKDDGTGFDMRFAGKLFKPFQRIHRAEEYTGTGIGLASVHKIIERHGGRIWAEGEVGKGAVFYFTLTSGSIVERQYE